MAQRTTADHDVEDIRRIGQPLSIALRPRNLRAVRVLLDGTPQHRCGQIDPYDHADTTGIQSKHRGVARAATHVEHNGIDRNIMDAHSVRAMSCGWR